MKLSKEQEKELMLVYNAYWEGYLKGDVVNMASLLAEEYTQVGSAEGEVFFTKKDAIQFLYDTIEQVAVKLEMRNREVKIEVLDDLVLVSELTDIYALTEQDWIFYSRFRASTLMMEKKEGWRLIHQHSSFPDTRTEAGQNVAIEKIAEENLQLREAVKRRTIELEQKNRELEIETSLEKVRAIAMGLKKPNDMPDVCKTISLQLELLGVKEIRNVQTAIFYEDRGSYMNYEYYAKHDKKVITETSYTNHEIHKDFAAKMLKGRGEFYSTHIRGEEVKDWIAYQKTTNVFIDTWLEKANSVNYYWYSLGPVALGISTYSPLSEEETNLFKRFLNVFELAYRRYLDIEKAEIQAREAKIELALERVRARTMAMQKSDELTDTSFVLFQQFKDLGETSEQISIGIFKEDENIMELYSTVYGSQWNEAARVDLDEPVVMKKIHAAWKEQKKSVVIDLTGNDLREYNAYRNKLSSLKYKEDRWVIHIAFFSKGVLTFSAIEPYPHETIGLLERFAAVFDGTYTRFLDLKKAEAQAREAQIEVALERVRSKALAMQKSDDLANAVAIVFEELNKLNLGTLRCGIGILNKEKRSGDLWTTTISDNNTVVQVSGDESMDIHPLLKGIFDAWLKQEADYNYVLKGEDLNNYYKALTGVNFRLPDSQSLVSGAEGIEQYHYNALFPAGGLFAFRETPFPEEAKMVMRRFADVFNLTYTRFNDLKQAEAQAREAQIELALERVRARTMAMQKSEELPDAANLLFQQVQALGMPAWSAGYCIWDDDKQGITLWMSSEDVIQPSFHLPLTDDPSLIHMKDAYERKEPFHVEAVGSEELVSHYRYMRTLPGIGAILDSIIDAGHPLPTFQIFHCAYFSQGFLLFITYEPVPEAHDIFKRFGKVFDQTYTRFLDLQKAEAQAREAQIETALEKVRSRSLAMHSSEELQDVVAVVFERLKELNISIDAANIVIFSPGTRDADLWIASPGQAYVSCFHLPYIDLSIPQDIFTAKEDEEHLFAKTYSFEEKNKYFNYLFDHSDFKHLPQNRKDKMLAGPAYAISFAFTKNAAISIHSFAGKAFSDSENDLLKRFAKVFEQAYIRFLDLQKAEAQARESKIESSLERVRSKAMAMHNSEDLATTIGVFYHELQTYSITPRRCGVGLLNKESRAGELFTWNTTDQGESMQLVGKLKMEGHPVLEAVYDNWLLQKEYHPVLKGNEIKEYYQLLRPQMAFPDYTNNVVQYGYFFFFNEGGVYAWTEKEMAEEELQIYRRFTTVLSLTYKRYLDLNQAEAQAREAQIELSLERVRAKTMAMHNSQDVADTVATLFDEVVKLGIETFRCGIGIMNETKVMELWTAKADDKGKTHLVIGHMDMTIHPLLQGAIHGWENKQDSYTYELAGDDLINYFSAVNNYPGYPVKYDVAALPEKIFHRDFYFPEGTLFVFSLESLSAESQKIFKRFSGVFGQTYRRYLDLKKAEAQARHAQIEAAMEKVRARSLAMQKPEELVEVAEVLRKEMGSLGVEELETSSIYILDETTGLTECWYAIKDIRGEDKQLVSDHMIINLQDTWVGREMMKFYTSTKKQISILMQGENRKEWINYCSGHSNVLQGYYGDEIPERTYHLFKFSNGYMGAASPGNISAESWELLQRAATVFSLAYRRFLDLQKAEAQTREAQVELALERVRARTMAMFKSDELAETAAVLFQQLIALGIVPNRLFIGLINDESGDIEAWATNEDGTKVSEQFVLSSKRNNSVKKMYDGWNEQKKSITIDMQGKELEKYFHYLDEELHVPFKLGLTQKRRVQYIAYFSKGFIGIASPDEQPQSTVNLLERFAGVFNLTYTRFVDLQRAEAQAREATIEAALEKVRGKAMAMHNSNDLSSTANMVFVELRNLGITAFRSGISLQNKNDRKNLLYSAASSMEGGSLSLVGWALLDGHPVLSEIYDSWTRGEDYFPVLKGELLKSYYERINNTLVVPVEQANYEQYGYFIAFSAGVFYGWSEKPFSDIEKNILRRFASVIDLTFKRYFDLQKSEANTRDAVRQASLDRVRAEIASMRTTNDLERITPLIWTELNILGVPFIRCGVFIMDDGNELIHTFLSTPEGKAIAAFHLPYTTPGNIQQVLAHWHHKENYIDHWDETAFTEFADTLVKQGALHSSEQYLKTIPHEGFHLHFLPFLQGMLYVGNTTRLGDDEIKLIQSVADAFSTAYARYEDFNKLESAKEQIEKTLVDLKQAQAQLVQSEKMASLGELTAGIAHEIQNPLNFVNNFSDVNAELIEELKKELREGNDDEVLLIANDIKANEEKINHHGKRADSIVKGMLQHSRSSSNTKEPTDLNALADEYLRLSYHGLRAKDKSFNATMKTAFDPALSSSTKALSADKAGSADDGKINVIPQDIGRVLLNLYNNAFYASSAKALATAGGKHEPSVWVSTKKNGDKVLISVRDNGPGIPQKILDKIFQPFFTTKPTGQGTGLGLSLAYDIVKAHGGEIKVNTKENEGTEFIISLPS